MNKGNRIIGVSADFDLLEDFRKAASVTLIMAFAKMTGWQAIREAILEGTTQVNVIVGLNFAITEPDALSEWLQLKKTDPYRFSIEVAPTSPVFHPKVIVVERSDGSRFAIIGSGNLTGGGLSTNVECGAFVEDESSIDEVEEWCAQLAREPLTEQLIKEYRAIYLASARALWQNRKQLAKLNRLLGAAKAEPFARPVPVWDVPGFLRDMDACLASESGSRGLKNREEGARQIRAALRMPNLNFDKAGWETFYGIAEFGRIRQSYKAMSSETATLRRTVRLLTGKPLEEQTLEEIIAIDGKFHVRGFGTNIASKILTVSDRSRWPVFNHPVQKTLHQYGFKVDWGAINYLTFASTMRRVLSRRGRPDFWAMDVFCEERSRSGRY